MLTEPDFKEKKIILVFTSDKDKISFKNDNLIIVDKEDKIKLQISCYRIFALFIVGNMTLTSGIIQRSKKFGFSLVLFTSSFKPYLTISYYLEGNTLLHKKQYTNENEINIAREIIKNKIENQKKTLQKLRDKSLDDGIKLLNENIQKLNNENYTNYEIMGIEGISSKIYFKRLFRDNNWKGRKPRAKKDEINLLMDIGYTVLFNFIETILNIYGFDIYKGNLHREFYKRKSLVCDIIEPFRPIIDYKIRKMINLKQIENYKFEEKKGQFSLDYKYSNDFVKNILEEIIKYKIQIFKYIQAYYRWFMKNKDITMFPKVGIDNDIN